MTGLQEGRRSGEGSERHRPPSEGPRRIGRPAVGTLIALLLASAIALWFGPGAAPVSSTESTAGAQLYTQHCAACHQAAGQGIDGTFPPLAGNPAAADADYVETAIREGVSGPIEVLGVGYDTVMPPVVGLTDDAEIAQVVDYVIALAGPAAGDQDDEEDGQSEPAAPAEESAAEPVDGDVDRGHDLFIGATRFENDGPACAACHTAGSVGNLGGQSLGPDLTGAFEALGGEVGLRGWMANPPSATMQPLFADRPLSEAELADVVTFLADAPSQGEPSSGFDRLTAVGLVGLGVLLAGMAVVWRGMRQTYVQRLQRRPAKPSSRRAGPGRSPGRRRPTEQSRRQPESVETARSSR